MATALAERPAPKRSFEPLEEDTSHRRFRFTGDQMIQLAEMGWLEPDKKYELLDGEILEKMAANPPHAGIVGLVAEVLRRIFGPTYIAREEKPVRLDIYFDPQPDIAVVKGRHSDYFKRFPSQSDIALVVEVSDSSVNFDRKRKQEAYALGELPEYWLVNLVSQQVEVYRQPVEGRYAQMSVHHAGEYLTPLAAPAVTASISELLGVE